MAKMIGGKRLLDAINRESEMIELGAGVVDQHVDTVIAFPDLPGQSADLGQRAKIRRKELDTRVARASNGGSDRISFARVPADKDERRPEAPELYCSGSPQSGGRARD